jgi:chromosome segregation ATPase
VEGAVDDVVGRIFSRINERLRDKEAERNGEWSRFHSEIARLVERVVAVEARCDHLQDEVDECRQREGEWMRRAIAAEAASEGLGEARQQAQRIVSIERLEPKKDG